MEQTCKMCGGPHTTGACTTTEVTKENIIIPPQYEGLEAEVVDELWQIPMYTDPEKNRAEAERKARALEELKRRESESK